MVRSEILRELARILRDHLVPYNDDRQECGCGNVIKCRDVAAPGVLQAVPDGIKVTNIASRDQSGNINVSANTKDPVVTRDRFTSAGKA